MRGGGGDGADLAALTGDHRRQNGFHSEPDALRVDVHDTVPEVLVDLVHGVARDGDAGVADEDVDRTELRPHFRDESAPSLGVAHIEGEGLRFSAFGGYAVGGVRSALDVD